MDALADRVRKRAAVAADDDEASHGPLAKRNHVAGKQFALPPAAQVRTDGADDFVVSCEPTGKRRRIVGKQSVLS